MTIFETQDNLEQCVIRLGLKLGPDGWYCGRIRGFPVGLKMVDPSGGGSLIIACPLAAVLGGVAWALSWIAYDLVFKWLGTDKIQAPKGLMVSLLVLLTFGVGGPVGWILKNVGRKHFGMLRAALIILFTSLGIVFGETMYLTWLIYRDFHVVAPIKAFEHISTLWMSAGSDYVGLKIMAAVASVAVALISDPSSTKPKYSL